MTVKCITTFKWSSSLNEKTTFNIDSNFGLLKLGSWPQTIIIVE